MDTAPHVLKLAAGAGRFIKRIAKNFKSLKTLYYDADKQNQSIGNAGANYCPRFTHLKNYPKPIRLGQILSIYILNRTKGPRL